MSAARKHPEHSRGVIRPRRLPEDLLIHDDGRVRRQHQSAGGTRADWTGLGFGDTADVGLGRFIRSDALVNVGRLNLNVDSSLAKQVGASRGRGGQNQPHGPLSRQRVASRE